MNHENKFKGFTLLEILIALGAISVLSAGTFAGYQVIHSRSQVTETVQSVRDLSNNLMQTYGNAGSFNGVSSASIAEHGMAPGMTVEGDQLKTPWGGTVDVENLNNQAFSVTLNGVPSYACANVASQLSRNFVQVSVNGTVVKDSTAGTGMDVGLASKICGIGDKNALALISQTVAQPDFGEVPLPSDHGAVPKLPVTVPATLGAQSVAPVAAVQLVMPTTQAMPSALKAPSVSSAVGGGSVSVAVGSAPTTPMPAFPGAASCIPSQTNSPATSTEYNTQTIGCQAGYTGQIQQQQSRTKTVTTTTTVSCPTVSSTPVTSTTQSTSYGPYTAWADTSNTCSPMCSTRLGSGSWGQQASYGWITVNVGCPAGYSGSHTYQAQTVQTRTASCANPTAAVDPVYGGWTAPVQTGVTQNDSNSCVQNTPPPPTPSIAFAMWGGMIDVSPSATATSFQIGITCLPGASSPIPASIQSVANSGLVTSNNGFDTFKPALVIGAGSGGQAQVTAMTAALPSSSCTFGIGFWNTTAWVRACNSGGCSGWAQATQFCSWSRC